MNPALFIVITETVVFNLARLLTNQERATVASWQKELLAIDGFNPVVIGKPITAADPLHPE